MHDDLSNPTTLSRLARRFVIAFSIVLAIGLTGVVFARAEQQRTRIVWVAAGLLTPAPMIVADASVPDEPEPIVADPDETDSEPPVEPAEDAQPARAVIAPSPAARVMLMEVTAYCACTSCCGPQAQGITASGKLVSYNDGRFVAADTRILPFGTRLIIPGYADEQPVEVIDRGGAIKGNKLDVYFHSHAEALVWGRQMLHVTVEP